MGEDPTDLLEVSSELLSRLKAKPWDYLYLSSGETSCILQAVPQREQYLVDDTVFVHPLLFEYLISNTLSLEMTKNEEDSSMRTHVRIAPFPYSPCSTYYTDHHCELKAVWNLQKIATCKSVPKGTTVHLECLYIDLAAGAESHYHHHPRPDDPMDEVLERMLIRSLAGRVVSKKSLMLVPTHLVELLLVVKDIQAESVDDDKATVYRLDGEPNSFSVQLQLSNMDWYQEDSQEGEQQQNSAGELNCPGYEPLVASMRQLLELAPEPAAPTGILLTGCGGVGKTRLLSCVVQHVLAHQKAERRGGVHWISMQDLILKASWATEEEILLALLPTKKSEECLLVLDDLDALVTEEDKDSLGGEALNFTNDMERRLVWNSVLQVLDRAAALPELRVVGIARGSLPREITKIGRLEKEISIQPPSQQQRESILQHLLQLANVPAELCSTWAELLASATPGCVAADLHRLVSDAWTRAMSKHVTDESSSPTWEDLLVAAQNCIPSQLAQLDVTKPRLTFENTVSKNDWAAIHAESWKRFVGYEATKKRLFRTVVVPWRRALISDGSSDTGDTGIAPPSGVVFYGASGVGKTLGATCLGASLGLPMIKVRAADVLDKWLGGSEAAIRSLFAAARAASPCILFFDEIDAIASNRSQDGETADVMSRLLSTLLNEMDGVSSGRKAKVLVIACTNRLGALDSALVRPGRLEEHVPLEKPSVEDAEAILRFGLGQAPLDDSVNLVVLARKLVGAEASGAQIEGVGRDAVLRWLRNAETKMHLLSSEHIEGAMRSMHLYSNE